MQIINKKYNIFNIDSINVKNYINYLVKRSNIWADKYINKQDYSLYSDKIFDKYHLCNIWRELDKFSKEEIKRIRNLTTLKDKVKLVLLSRHSISFPTIDILLSEDCTLEKVYEHWEICKQTANLDFVSNAIQMYPDKGFDRAKEIWYHRQQVYKYIDEFIDTFNKNYNAMYYFSKIPCLFNKVGGFKAYEIYTSLTYLEEVYFKEDDVFLVGPGAVGGLHYVTNYNFNPVDSQSVLIDLSYLVKEHLLNKVEDFYWIPKEYQGSVNNKEDYKFTVRTLEDSLCEMRKYNNFLNNKGKRRKYNINRII